ncbi:DUF6600 domain-containing protein [Pedobacter heparinus]|uniref:DUF6600 domain-containing protein n=1 Tax=Pedobacter heparinus TaxID=984 RepID=UPI00292EF380|nr:DUF6600 domain-containing protein [Pedobacter heparinus]
MKNMIKLPAIVLGLLLLLTGATQKVMAQGDDVSLQSFYDELSPYGTWIQDPQYGYVWRPDVEQGDFRPYYSNGRWAMTEYGNTWVSNYDWGWAPFHYGRWVYNRYNEWVWIPDTTWGPAWVSWRSGGGYYGWAPMGPGMNVNINFNIPDLWWVFIPQRNIYYDSFPRYYSRRNVTIIHNTIIINNTYVNNRRTYYSGPRADDIRRATGRDVRVYNVNTTGRPSRSNINGNNVDIYTPRPSRGSSNANARPREAIRGEGYTTARGDRGTSSNGSPSTRPSRGDNGSGVTAPSRGERPAGENNGRPSRIGNRENNSTQPQRTERGNPSRENNPRETPAQRPEQMQPAPQQRQERPERQARPERQESRPEAPRMQERPQQQQPQRQERPAQPQERPQQQPQRQESRPQPQYQRPERIQQSAPPARSSESRGNQGGGGRTESSRPSRGGRG